MFGFFNRKTPDLELLICDPRVAAVALLRQLIEMENLDAARCFLKSLLARGVPAKKQPKFESSLDRETLIQRYEDALERVLKTAKPQDALTKIFANLPEEGLVGFLISAAGDGFTDVVELLLDFVDVNVADINGETPLISAAGRGRTDVVDLLLARGADVAAEDMSGWTAARAAREFGHTRIARQLA